MDQRITEVSATVDAGLSQEDLDSMNEAERLALVVGAAYGKALADRDDARAMLATATDLLNQAHGILAESTWAAETHLAESIQAFLSRVESAQAPTTEGGTDAPSDQ